MQKQFLERLRRNGTHNLLLLRAIVINNARVASKSSHRCLLRLLSSILPHFAALRGHHLNRIILSSSTYLPLPATCILKIVRAGLGFACITPVLRRYTRLDLTGKLEIFLIL